MAHPLRRRVRAPVASALTVSATVAAAAAAHTAPRLERVYEPAPLAARDTPLTDPAPPPSPSLNPQPLSDRFGIFDAYGQFNPTTAIGGGLVLPDLFESAWAYDNAGQDIKDAGAGTTGSDIDVVPAWRSDWLAQGITVGDVDSGINLSGVNVWRLAARTSCPATPHHNA